MDVHEYLKQALSNENPIKIIKVGVAFCAGFIFLTHVVRSSFLTIQTEETKQL